MQNLDLQNKHLLSKWLLKLYNEDGIWQELLRNEYIKDKTLSRVTKNLAIPIFGWGFWE